ncbi:YraN family protein [Rubinisphaera sp. JC750]|uniref:YraN family protein n=1 Tax=Rubinisphaera sp. JC750 TaxID=2898658 RepID=UPI001F025D18|nr:YraN family protein [Rubinisphaera sp. JC750]
MAPRWLRWPFGLLRSESSTGARGEKHAARYLRRLGLKIIGRNVHNRFGELDIVARDRDCIIFVEVRTRSSTRRGTPAETIGPAKQRTLSRAALSYLKSHGLLDRPARFDVITVVWDESGQPADLKHIENAFSPGE